jgi:hypothetical protein
MELYAGGYAIADYSYSKQIETRMIVRRKCVGEGIHSR